MGRDWDFVRICRKLKMKNKRYCFDVEKKRKHEFRSKLWGSTIWWLHAVHHDLHFCLRTILNIREFLGNFPQDCCVWAFLAPHQLTWVRQIGQNGIQNRKKIWRFAYCNHWGYFSLWVASKLWSSQNIRGM